MPYIGRLLVDDMGLGKTIQPAAARRHTWDKADNRRHSLVVCPKSVTRHWARAWTTRASWPSS